MKNKSVLLALALALAAGGGCMTNSLPKIIAAMAKDTNSFSLKFNGWGANIELLRNGGGVSGIATTPEAASVTVTPMTTLRVQPTK